MQTKTVDLLGHFFMKLVFIHLAMAVGALISGGDSYFVVVAFMLGSTFFFLSVICAHVVVGRRQP